jgi:rhodanese-related sulfurtransferase
VKVLCVALATVFTLTWAGGSPTPAAASAYRYLSGPELERKLKAHESMDVVDIQVLPEFAKHHIQGAIPTYSYPVKSAEDKSKLDAVLPKLRASTGPVVIVCPRGAGGAERAYEHLKERGIPEARLFILEKGQAGWTSAEWTVGK